MPQPQTINYRDLDQQHLVDLADCLWGSEDQERYHCTSPDEAIEAILDDVPPGDPLPSEVRIVAMKPMKVTADDIDASNILNDILERLDETYSDPDGDNSEPTEGMKAAAQQLAQVVAKEYKPWACEPVLYVVLDDVKKWAGLHFASSEDKEPKP